MIAVAGSMPSAICIQHSWAMNVVGNHLDMRQAEDAWPGVDEAS